jgi:polyhydroxybutyrate depolymerase
MRPTIHTLLILLIGAVSTIQAADITLTPGATTVNQFTSGAFLRTVKIHTPSGYNGSTPIPLVVCFHGGGSDAQQQETLTGMSAKADSAGFFVAYPEGYLDAVSGRRTFADGRGTTAAELAGVDDVAFTRDIINRIAAAGNLDRTRVYATGISNGGLMSQRLGLQLSTRIAAIAPVAANLAQPLAAGFAPQVPVAVAQFSGTADTYSPYAGGMVIIGGVPDPTLGEVTGAEADIALWTAANGCNTVPLITDPYGANVTTDGCTALLRNFQAGANSAGADVILVKITGGGHTWPGSAFNPPSLGNTCMDFNATTQIWAFFAAHPKKSPVLVADVATTQGPNGTATVVVAATDDGGSGNLTYTWSATGPGSMNFTPNGNSTAATTTATATTNGTYIVTVAIRDADGYTITNSRTLVINSLPGGGSSSGTSAGSSGGGGCGAGTTAGLIAAVLLIASLRASGCNGSVHRRRT